ncbi:methylated-DNA--[protein]-cysteine S-methyltransferase [Thiomicrorhabdus xiamenensis]|uniref:methylated-DNA--[protein]-cysteine S-methyltransferase n=1 Tax=Thiomicrorhabdus xiamenensis TaxID=2739063 RepID=A0A7D4NPB8_9GAMM|nr:MGMT family protein [Thiomicrorhabdus xiamenensis]QKI89513.1 MGMT family protein [Thiomicrorhabdus xiamenensis]
MKKDLNKNSHLSFSEQVYQLLLDVPKGKVTTYAALAHALDSRAYRAVGSAMAKNRLPLIIPCHRVIKNNGEIGNYALGKKTKEKLLKLEGIRIKDGKVLDLEQVLFVFGK